MDKMGEYTRVDSLVLPEGYIKGNVGAGDAFCAGVLYSAYRELPMEESLRLGVAAAVCSLRSEDATGGMVGAAEAIAEFEQMKDLLENEYNE